MSPMRLAPSRPHTRRLSRRLAAVVAVLLTCVVPAAVAMKPVPLDWKHTVGDPSVVKTSKNYVVISTGAKVNRALSKKGKVWKWKSSALPVLPSWANANGGDIWAADMQKIGGRYVLYFAAPVKGKTGTSRCIGVATSTSAKGTFTPVGNAPLVCPSSSWFGTVPTAADKVVDPGDVDSYNQAMATYTSESANYQSCESSGAAATQSPTPATDTPTPTPGSGSPSPTDDPSTSTAPVEPSQDPTPHGPTVLPDPCASLSPSGSPTPPTTASNVIGAIDPSFFQDVNGAPYLLYKTDGIPSSIRLLPLSSDGLRPAPNAMSQTLVNDAGVLENPVMVHRNGVYYLFNSHGDYARCSYSTVWRASGSLTNWSASPAHTLLTRKNTHKLCGPGGADMLVQGKKVTTYFEAWTCKRSWKPCGHKFWAFSSAWQRKHPVRALYAAKLGFKNGAPHVKKYLKGSKKH